MCLFPPQTRLEEVAHHFCKQMGHRVVAGRALLHAGQDASSLGAHTSIKRQMCGPHLPTPHPRAGFPSRATWKGNIALYLKSSEAVRAPFHQISRMFAHPSVRTLKALCFCMSICHAFLQLQLTSMLVQMRCFLRGLAQAQSSACSRVRVSMHKGLVSQTLSAQAFKFCPENIGREMSREEL